MLKIKRKNRAFSFLLMAGGFVLAVYSLGQIGNLLKAAAALNEFTWQKGTSENIVIDDVYDSNSEKVSLKLDDAILGTSCYVASGGSVTIDAKNCLVGVNALVDHTLTAVITSKTDANVSHTNDYIIHLTTKEYTWQKQTSGSLVLTNAYNSVTENISLKIDENIAAATCYSAVGGDIAVSGDCLMDLEVGGHVFKVIHTKKTDPSQSVTDDYAVLIAGSNSMVPSSTMVTLYKISFDKNAVSSVTNMPDTLVATSTDASYAFTLPAETPTRKGYNFLGWNLLPEMDEASFAPGDIMTLSVNASDTDISAVTLYAIWEDPKKDEKKDKDGGKGETGDKGLRTAVARTTSGNEEEEEDTSSTRNTAGSARTTSESVAYSLTESTQNLSNGSGLEITGSGNADKFVSLYIDDTLIGDEHYTIDGDTSTTLTLSSAFLSTLSAGNHTLLLIWEDGRASGNLSIDDGIYTISSTTPIVAVPDTNNGAPETGFVTKQKPNAGDVTPFIFVVSLTVFSVIFIVRRRATRVCFNS